MKTGLKKALLASAGVALVAGAVAAPAMAADKGSDHGKKPAGISQKAPGKGDAKPGKGSKPSKGVKDAGPLQAAGMTPAQVEAVALALRDHGDHAFADAQKTALAALVAAGTITQAQADAVTAGWVAPLVQPADAAQPVDGVKKDSGRDGHGGLDALIAAGTITQAQADALHEEMGKAMAAAKTAHEAKALAALVAAGTITQAQADEIAANLAKAVGGHGNAHGPVMDKGSQDVTTDAGRPSAEKPGVEDEKEGSKSEKPEGPRGEHGRGARPVPAASPAA